MNNEDFYFVYFPIGYDFVKTMECTFKYIPEDTNVIVITNNLKLVNQKNIKFNLTLLHIDDLRDEWSLKNEKLIYADSAEEYRKQLKTGEIKFPYSAHRFILPWLLQEKNATRFALLDSDCLLNYDGNLKQSLNYLKKFAGNKNYFLGRFYEEYTEHRYLKLMGENIINRYGINPSLVDSLGYTYPIFDGFFRGFWFNEREPVEVFFKIWNELVQKATDYQINYFNGKIIIADEWIHGFAAMLLREIFEIEDFSDAVFTPFPMVKHVYHPENMYFDLSHNLYRKYGMKESFSRHQFLIDNKINLEGFYKKNHDLEEFEIKNIIYDWEDVFKS